MMSDYEEDVGDFPSENIDKPDESSAGAYRAESTCHWTAGSGITTKIPPLFDGSTFWFKYEELIDDWLDPAVLESRKARTSTEEQTCRRCINMHKGLLDRESLSAENGVKYFRGTLRPHFIKGAQSVFFWRFYQFIRARRGSVEIVKSIGKFSLLLKRLRDAPGWTSCRCPL